MSELKFFIVEDDPGVTKILAKIIESNRLGTVEGTAEDGFIAVDAIRVRKPDVVIVDFLLPGMDGLGIMEAVADPGISFIMISEVADKEMVAKAYQAGIEFYIHKPVNIIEVLSVIRRVSDNIRLRNAVETLDHAFSMIRTGATPPRISRESAGNRSRLRYILAQLGIQGDSGSRDVEEAVLWLTERNSTGSHGAYRLADLYGVLCRLDGREGSLAANAAVEQRMRRTVSKVLNNLASMGLDDYGNDIFCLYAPMLFDFSEVRRHMSYVKGTSKTPGKISIKKFIEGLATELEHGQQTL